MPTYKLNVTCAGKTRTISASGSDSILTALQAAGCTQMNAPCGGGGTCGQCKVLVTGKVTSCEGDLTADSTELLACRWAAASDCEIAIPDGGLMRVVTSGAGDISPCGEGLGIAVDIGTTTVAMYLYDLATGEQLAVKSAQNEQRAYGADVISRILFCSNNGGLSTLCDVIRKQLSGLINDVCHSADRRRGEITRVSIAANTVMEHIFAKLSPSTIGVAPFTTLSLFGMSEAAAPYFDGLSEGAHVYLCPALAGYVGGDITAGLLSSGAARSEVTCLFIDIGTNGEMGIGDKNGFVCCATAAGPAFEGAEIECGSGGIAGAISTVRYVDGEIICGAIGGGKPATICGSGLVDAISVLLQCGAVEESGRMCTPNEAPESLAPRIHQSKDGVHFHLTDTVYVTANDVRKIQLAKSAIRAGIETLLKTKNLLCDDIGEVLLAGGFGAYLNIDSACAIGLLPPAFIKKARHIGNSAGAGAALALDLSIRAELQSLTNRCEYIELSSSPLFMEKYIECMVFDESEDAYESK